MIDMRLDGGTGRRARLKIWFRQRSAGSIPVLGTTPPFLGGFFMGWNHLIFDICASIQKTEMLILSFIDNQ